MLAAAPVFDVTTYCINSFVRYLPTGSLFDFPRQIFPEKNNKNVKWKFCRWWWWWFINAATTAAWFNALDLARNAWIERTVKRSFTAIVISVNYTRNTSEENLLPCLHFFVYFIHLAPHLVISFEPIFNSDVQANFVALSLRPILLPCH